MRSNHLLIIAGVAGAVLVMSLLPGRGKASGEGWHEQTFLENNLQQAHFVVVDDPYIQKRATYNAAASLLCPSAKNGWPICRVVFYRSVDPVPLQNTQLVGAILPEGFRTVLAAYATAQDGSPGEWHIWNCERAGVEGAPASALCGDVKVKFDAVVALALRSSRSVGCGWPRYDADADGARRLIQQTMDEDKRAVYRDAFNLFYGNGSSRPNNPNDCERLRPQIEAAAVQARKLLDVPPQPISKPRASGAAR